MKKKILLLICFIFLVGCSDGDKIAVNYVEAKEKIINENAVLVDVRTQEEYDDGHIRGAVLLTLDNINDSNASKIISDKDKVIIVYCRSGNRSHQAVLKLNDLGYKNVYDLGAMSNWKE